MRAALAYEVAGGVCEARVADKDVDVVAVGDGPLLVDAIVVALGVRAAGGAWRVLGCEGEWRQERDGNFGGELHGAWRL